jgi:hypothetical protein
LWTRMKSKKIRQGYWRSRLLNMKGSFLHYSPKQWVKSAIVDSVFIVLLFILLAFLVSDTVGQLNELVRVASEAIPLMPQSPAVNPVLAGKMSALHERIDQVTGGFFVVFLEHFALFVVLAGTWNYLAFSNAIGKRKGLLSWLRFLALSATWLVVWTGLIVLVTFILLGPVPGVLAGFFLFVTAFYASYVFFYSVLEGKKFNILKMTFKAGIMRIYGPGFAFLVCLLLLAGFNLTMYAISPKPSIALAVVFFALSVGFVSWCRFYLCAEIRNAVGDAGA